RFKTSNTLDIDEKLLTSRNGMTLAAQRIISTSLQCVSGTSLTLQAKPVINLKRFEQAIPRAMLGGVR
ncbi:hypothetical protein, partial [Rhizobium leguminosarum]|uniref:hypothetical protein n=1 Tax=Rhizobium leguminosarum TaxID=384 RepID=UPI001980B529